MTTQKTEGQELAEVLRQHAEFKAEMLAHSRRCRARNLQDPDFVAREQWGNLYKDLLKSVPKMVRYGRIYPCPNRLLPKLREEVARLSDILERFGTSGGEQS